MACMKCIHMCRRGPRTNAEQLPFAQKARVLRCVSTNDLPKKQKDFVRKLGRNTNHRWIVLEVEEVTNGSPVFDAKGKLVGICAWSDGELIYALSAAHISRMLGALFPGPLPIAEGMKPNPRALEMPSN